MRSNINQPYPWRFGRHWLLVLDVLNPGRKRIDMDVPRVRIGSGLSWLVSRESEVELRIHRGEEVVVGPLGVVA